MRFTDIVVYREARFSLGVEEDSGRFYLSIPVSNPYVDYSEYYEVDQVTFERYLADFESACEFAGRCRNRELDDLLIVKPGRLRGSPA
jgi:hypothetical protein